MGRKQKFYLFLMGGGAYVALEFIWRGRSHISMFLAGGSCFLLLGWLGRRFGKCPALFRWLAGAGVITAVELVAGLLFNRDYRVWDYRNMPVNFLGQICLLYSILWVPVSALGMRLHTKATAWLTKRQIVG